MQVNDAKKNAIAKPPPPRFDHIIVKLPFIVYPLHDFLLAEKNLVLAALVV
jgi:hypothetical protein